MKITAIALFVGLLPFKSFSQDSVAVIHPAPKHIPDTVTMSTAIIPDTILLNNGNILVAHVTDTLAGTVFAEKLNSRKHKKLEIDREEVFSIKFGSSGREVVNYIYDTLTGHDLTVAEARAFIQGEQDAQRGFHAVGISIASFAIGVGSGIGLGSIFSFGPPFIFAGIVSYPAIRVRRKSVKDLKIATTDPYLYGYDMTARRKRTLHSIVWSGVGLAVGLVINTIIFNKQ